MLIFNSMEKEPEIGTGLESLIQSKLTIDSSNAPQINIQLFDTQINHFTRAVSILLNNHCFIDTSVMGSGKSFIIMALSQYFDIPLLVFCPGVVEGMWRSYMKDHSIKDFGENSVITYTSLVGKEGHPSKFDIIRRNDNIRGIGKFTATENFHQIIKHGALVVFDEAHSLKNNSDQFKACTALTRAMISTVSSSRFCVLSATLMDKEEQACNMVKFLGFVTGDKMYDLDRETKKVIPHGLGQLIETCKKYDENKTNLILSGNSLKIKKNIKLIVFKLFTEVIKNRVMSSMIPPVIKAKKDAKNGYYKMPKKNMILLDQAISELASATNFNVSNEDVDNTNLGGITTALVKIEAAKISTFARLARERLSREKNSKVICCLNYVKENLPDLVDLLKDYEPLVLYGKIEIKFRDSIIKAFQTDPTRRLLICNIKIGGIGISLHDIVGNSPRTMYVSPNYSIQDSHQAGGRIYRVGTLSTATIRFVYGAGKKKETGILMALAKKTNVLKASTGENNKDVRYPGEYENYEEM